MKFFLTVVLLCSSFVPALAAKMPAAELPSGLDWLNVEKPLTLKELRGKFVLLDFWTYCCINCQHIIPDLHKLEEKYPNELVVIGVHSAKFNAEGDTENIRQAVLRYGIEHPVVNDQELQAWGAYSANSWPTLVLIDPDGNIIARKSGEGVFAPIDAAIQAALPSFDKQLNPKPLALSLEKDKKPKTILEFPGKITADPDGKRLFIADSGHNRIVVTDLAGQISQVIGSGAAGGKDGKFNEAEFSGPQGMAYANNYLYIADTLNHLIRRADLVNKTVTTIAGTGIQGFDRAPKGEAMRAALSSPWDLVLLDGQLYIAMAGTHQIWVMDLNRGTVKNFAGSGKENIVDGKLNESSLAQTSGITTDGHKLYFADSETSSVRMADLDPKGDVTTIIGQGLFQFGDADGDQSQARFQHPLGILYHDGILYVADTYNNKIKAVDPVNRNSRTFSSPEAKLDEPGGLAFLNGQFFVADTNNNRIISIDAGSGEPSVLDVRERRKEITLNLEKFVGERRVLPAMAGLKAIQLDLQLEKDYELLMPSQSFIRVFDSAGKLQGKMKVESLSTVMPVDSLEKEKIYVEAGLYFCRHGEKGLCLVKNILFEIRLKESVGKDTLGLQIQLPSGDYKNID